MNLQKIRSLLYDKRAFCLSILFNAANSHGDSFIDVRVLVWVKASVKIFHHLAIPGDGAHTRDQYSDVILELLTALCGDI